MYQDISPMKDASMRLKRVFDIFADHVKAKTGQIMMRDQLKDKGYPAPGKCFGCHVKILTGVLGAVSTNLGEVVSRDFDSDKRIVDASKHGVFCSDRCARNCCEGCGAKLQGGACPDPWCDDDQKRNRRVAF